MASGKAGIRNVTFLWLVWLRLARNEVTFGLRLGMAPARPASEMLLSLACLAALVQEIK